MIISYLVSNSSGAMHTNGTDSRLLKEFEIISGQHMELEIDLDITLEYLHLNDIVTLWL